MILPKVDKAGQWLARFFFVVFSMLLFQDIAVDSFSYRQMGRQHLVSAEGSPFKYYFAFLWDILIVLVSGFFGFIAKRK
ncbi:hypothetical protein [Marinobacter adhaerens]|uniref:hypothetical protein n=1 Tax=Marinobacter adhaerens TaxID=1033846 RepID=UPI001C5713BE|nr:hypothetical protein [Marinobacter adhaerens]MBW3227258.1 hypothetical protein [Marinobacter adhaerens]